MALNINGVTPTAINYNGSPVYTLIYNGVTVWTAAKAVTYYVDSGVSYQENINTGSSVLSPKTFTPAKSGWTFVGWREDNTASSSVLTSKTMGDGAMSLFAVFKQNITLTTVANGTSTPSTKQRYYNNGNVSDPTFTVSNPSNSNATFKGWSTSSSSTTVSYSSISGTAFSASTTLYAVFAYSNVSMANVRLNRDDPFYPSEAESFGIYATLASSVDFSKYSGASVSFNNQYYGSVQIFQNHANCTVNLLAKCGSDSVVLYSDYVDGSGNHQTSAGSGTKTLTFTKTSGTGNLIIVPSGSGHCDNAYANAWGTLIGRTTVG